MSIIETFDRGLRAAPAAARLMGSVLGWDEPTIQRELRHYRLRVDAERESQEQLDDLSADASRLGAPDVRMGDLRRPAGETAASTASSRPAPCGRPRRP